MFILNETASLVWDLSSEFVPPGKIASFFSETYSIDSIQAYRDVTGILSQWETDLLNPNPFSPGQSVKAQPPSTCYSSDIYRVNHQLVRISFSDPNLRDEISPRIEPLHTAEASNPELRFQVWNQNEKILLSQDTNLIASEENPNAIRAILLQELVRRTEPGREWLGILHAGACGHNDSCVLLAGSSHSGKTTLCAALIASGLKFYCDDSAAIGRNDSRISPMPFRMMLREGSWDVLHSRFPEIISSSVFQRFGEKVRFLAPPPEQLAASAGLPKALVFVSFSPGEKTSFRPLLPLETLLRLKESGFWIEHDRKSIGAFLEWLQSLPAFALDYSDLDEAVSQVQALSHL